MLPLVLASSAATAGYYGFRAWAADSASWRKEFLTNSRAAYEREKETQQLQLVDEESLDEDLRLLEASDVAAGWREPNELAAYARLCAFRARRGVTSGLQGAASAAQKCGTALYEKGAAIWRDLNRK